MLSVIGDADSKVSVTSAMDFNERHREKGHKLRVLPGANRALDGHVKTVAASINDWIEGARRLNADDSGAWRAPSEGSSARPILPQAPLPPSLGGAPVGSMAKVLELQAECMCEDLPVSDEMTQWSEAKVRDFFERGGVECESSECEEQEV